MLSSIAWSSQEHGSKDDTCYQTTEVPVELKWDLNALCLSIFGLLQRNLNLSFIGNVSEG